MRLIQDEAGEIGQGSGPGVQLCRLRTAQHLRDPLPRLSCEWWFLELDNIVAETAGSYRPC